MRTTVKLQFSEAAQTAALFAALTAAGVGDPSTEEGLRVEYNPVAGIVTVDADKDVSDLLKSWTPPATADQQTIEAIRTAATLAQLKSALVALVQRDGGG